MKLNKEQKEFLNASIELESTLNSYSKKVNSLLEQSECMNECSLLNRVKENVMALQNIMFEL